VLDGVEHLVAQDLHGFDEIDVTHYHSVTPRFSHGRLWSMDAANLLSSSARLRSARATLSRSSDVTPCASRSLSEYGATASSTSPVIAPTSRWCAELIARSTLARIASGTEIWCTLDAVMMRAESSASNSGIMLVSSTGRTP